MKNHRPAVSIVIPTYRREQVLLDSIRYLIDLETPAAEILIVDQSERHETATEAALRAWDREGKIRWVQLPQPSITHAMNTGLRMATNEIVLFLDDDIIPAPGLVAAHINAHAEKLSNIVAGQVLQPGEEVLPELPDGAEFLFRSGKRAWLRELMGGNFSVAKNTAMAIGGFDENFVRVAYRFEAEFCDRAISAGEKILFEPAARINHLRASAGGTRSYGEHLKTIKPSHSVGAYYFLLRARNIKGRFRQMLLRPLRAVRTRHHMRNPWWIPLTLVAELGGLLWAISLIVRGSRLIQAEHTV